MWFKILFVIVCFKIGRKVTTNIWNTQGFRGKNLNLFIFLMGNHCYWQVGPVCECNFGGICSAKAESDVTTNVCLLFLHICKCFSIFCIFCCMKVAINHLYFASLQLPYSIIYYVYNTERFK